jgi:hypothetical protein
MSKTDLQKLLFLPAILLGFYGLAESANAVQQTLYAAQDGSGSPVNNDSGTTLFARKWNTGFFRIDCLKSPELQLSRIPHRAPSDTRRCR